MDDVSLHVCGNGLLGRSICFAARSLLRAIAAGMIARRSPALSRGHGANSAIAINFANNIIFRNMEGIA